MRAPKKTSRPNAPARACDKPSAEFSVPCRHSTTPTSVAAMAPNACEKAMNCGIAVIGTGYLTRNTCGQCSRRVPQVWRFRERFGLDRVRIVGLGEGLVASMGKRNGRLWSVLGCMGADIQMHPGGPGSAALSVGPVRSRRSPRPVVQKRSSMQPAPKKASLFPPTRHGANTLVFAPQPTARRSVCQIAAERLTTGS